MHHGSGGAGGGDMGSLTSAMEVIQIPDDGNSESAARDTSMADAAGTTTQAPSSPTRASTLRTPQTNETRPFDIVMKTGPPANPIEFTKPRFERGRRDDVLCYNERTKTHDVARNVLFRDFSREYGDADGALHRVKQAYWPLPHKQKIRTIMGHVEICIVLTRCIRDANSDDDVSSGGDSSNDSEDDEDIVFQVTNKYVAVKVCYCDRMDRLRDRHAEDPLKEIAAMQIIGNAHPNVMGTIEVLFDGGNLNVVMPYCDSGDLFELLQGSSSTNNPATDDVGPGMSEPVARYWFRQVMAGVKYLHTKGICHRDLSPENVMIDEKNCLIIDMGMCLRVPYKNPNSNDPNNNNSAPVVDIAHAGNSQQQHQRLLIKPQGACGKLPYMSPEIYRNRTPFDSEAVDVWTSGTILFCMVTGNRSYQRPHSSDPQFYWMTNGLERLIQDWGVTLSSECMHLLKNMMQVDPRLRYTIDEVLNHPWFALSDQPPPATPQQRVHSF